MIKYNKKTKNLTIEVDSKFNETEANWVLKKINPNIIIFKHEDSYRLIDKTGKFHHFVNGKLKIKI